MAQINSAHALLTQTVEELLPVLEGMLSASQAQAALHALPDPGSRAFATMTHQETVGLANAAVPLLSSIGFGSWLSLYERLPLCKMWVSTHSWLCNALQVSTLAEAYRLMLQCDKLTWQMVEERIMQLNPCETRQLECIA